MSEDPYSRLYWRLVDDPKFAEIYSEDHHFATWLRLLMIADQAYPATAHLPALARKASVARLAEAGLIDLLPNGRFRLHGLASEREKRAQSGRNAAAVRWHNERNTSPMLAKPSLDKPRQEYSPPPQEGRRKNGTNPRAQGSNPRASGDSPRQQREAEKRAPVDIGSILRKAQEGLLSDSEKRHD